MAKPTMSDFAVMPRKLSEVSAAAPQQPEEKAAPQPEETVPAAPEPRPAAHKKPAKVEAGTRQPKAALGREAAESDEEKRGYRRKRQSAKARGYESRGFIVKEEHYQRFNDLRQAFKKEHGEEAGIVLINEALELLFRKHRDVLQEYYSKKLTNI
jgi:hypothetical protein